MLAGSFVEKIAAEVGIRHSALGTRPVDSVGSGKGGSSPVSANAEGDEDVSFEFGSNDQHELFGSFHDSEQVEHADSIVDTQPAAGGPLHVQEPGTEGEGPVEGFRAPGGAATLPEVIKFLIDRTGYVKVLEEEASPESYSRIENLQELVNAARDSADRAETLGEFLDHAALVSDTDQYDEGSRVTLMTLHSAKGLEFPLVFLVGAEEGLFPHSRTFLNPDEMEEERRLCYVGMTRAMDTLVLSRARYRRRYGSDLPEASVPSRFREEIPPQLMEEIGGSHRGSREPALSEVDEGRHYSYEDEDQSASSRARL